MTRSGWVLGTPAYISPEAAMGRPTDARADVYALGAVLYFLLCGRPPFEEESASALVYAHVHQEPSSPSEVLGRELPPDLEEIVLRALRKVPHERHASAGELALALSECALAGKWKLGDAIHVAKHSSRPPPPGGVDALMPPLRLR